MFCTSPTTQKKAWEGDKQTNNINTRTLRLLDQLGPEGRVGENPKYLIGQSAKICANPGHLKNKKKLSKDTIFKFLGSPMFCIQYMISSDLIFSMKLRIPFKLFFLSQHRWLYRSYNNPPAAFAADLFMTLTLHSQILATWTFSNTHDIVPWIGEKLHIWAEFQEFSRYNKYVRVSGKLSAIIPKSQCSPIQETGS